MKKYLIALLSICSLSIVGQELHNGIVLPEVWPPIYEVPQNKQDMLVPYLQAKPTVVPINTGRQLFVDDFLIAETDMHRVCHKANQYAGNPVLEPTEEWEKTRDGAPYAAPFSDGIWYDEVEKKFKMWYLAGGGLLHKQSNQTFYTCYAESEDGIHWDKTIQDIVPGTNIVDKEDRDAATIWLDKFETDPEKRYKMFNIERDPKDRRWYFVLKYSPDGINWNTIARSGRLYDRSTAFYNPFTNVWGLSLKQSTPLAYRSRYYIEHQDPDVAVSCAHRVPLGESDGIMRFWFTPSNKEVRHPKYPEVDPQIYNFDVIAYESIMIGQYVVWQGPENNICDSLGIQKRNQVALGYSRDGFHFHRPTHEMFMSVNETEGAWNWGNMQSVNGTPIIMGDSLYFYSSGRRLNDIMWDSYTSTGLFTLRRDGFASMQATGKEAKTLVTEPVSFDGSYMFVNANIGKKGALQVELLDAFDNVIEGYSKADCKVIKTNSTKQLVTWKQQANVAMLKDKVVKIKFYMTEGDLYSFWVSPWESGESRGYTAGGGPNLSPKGMDVK